MLSTLFRRLIDRGRRRPSPAIVVAMVALVLSMTGNAAAAIIISSNGQVAANTISGHHPPAGKHANLIARSVTDADLAVLPAWQAVKHWGSSEPAFACYNLCWQNSNKFADLPKAAFYKWHGEVHLKGNACLAQLNGVCTTGFQSGDAVIFRLPQGYRPKHTVIFRVASNPLGTDDATVYVQASTGNVVARNFAADGVDLNAISFRLDN